jgi:hypothetical protein
MRKPLTMLSAGFGVALAAGGLLLTALITATAAFGEQAASNGNSPGDILYAHPGLLVSVKGFRLFPELKWSLELNAKLLEIAQTKVALYDAYASEMQQMTYDETHLQQNPRSFGSRPIRVLTSGNHGVPADAPDRAKYEQEITRAQARWLALSSNSKQIFANSRSEYIQFDDPETVISAIRDVYDQSTKTAAAKD